MQNLPEKVVKISKGNKHLTPNWKIGSCPLPFILWEGRVPRLYIGGLFICYLRLLFTFTFFLFSFFFFFFSNGNDVIDVFWHENNITASSIHWCTLIFSTTPPGFFFVCLFVFVFFVFCLVCFVLFCFVF